MRFLLNIVLLFLPVLVFSQKLPEIDALNRVILNQKDSIIYAHLLPSGESENIKAKDKYWYSWYAQHDIKETQGGFGGKLLHGEYEEFYENKDLKKKGVFKKGLKTGKWKSWYKNGQLCEISHYKNGLKHGKYYGYTSSGVQEEKGKYKRGVQINKKTRKVASISKDAKEVKKDKIGDKGKTEKGTKREKKKSKDSIEPTIENPAPGEEKKAEPKKKKKEKKPQIRIRRGIKIVPQPGKST
jgi:hypothetical protein